MDENGERKMDLPPEDKELGIQATEPIEKTGSEIGPASNQDSKRYSSAASSTDEEAGEAKDKEAAHDHSRHDPELAVKRVVTAQDWIGPDDPENPHNWSLWKRTWHTLQPALFGFAVTTGSSIYQPGVPEIMEEFGVSQTAALIGVTLYVLGLGCGPVVSAPLSETFGRLIVYRVTLLVSMFFTLGVGFSQNFGSILVCRFLAGFSGAAVLSVGGGTNADLFPAKTRAMATMWFLLAPFLGTAFGPVIGGFAAEYKGWRWTQWCLLFLSLPIYLASLTTEETYKKAILQKRAKRLGIEPPKQALPPGLGRIKFLLTVTVFRPISMLIFEPIVLFLSLYSAFNFGVLFCFLPAFDIVFQGVYGFDSGQTGLTFLGIAVGCLFGVVTGLVTDRWWYRKEHFKAESEGRENVAPEHRLYAAMIGGFGVTTGLFWFGWSSRPDVHWIVPILGTIPFAWGNLSIFSSTVLYMVDVYGPLTGASALAANSLARYAVGAAFPLFTVQMYSALGIDWASSLLGFASLAMLPIPWIIYKWGPKIRAKSAYDTIKA